MIFDILANTHRALRTVVYTVIILGSIFFITSTANAAPTGNIGGRPAKPDTKNPRTESIFIHTVNRGESVQDTLLLMNNSDTTRRIDIYSVDGVVTNTGAYTCRQKSEATTDSGGWIVLDKNEVTLDPDQKMEVPFSITVPDNADVGEHNACLVFADKDEKAATSGNLRIHTRQAVRVVTTIPGDLHREVILTNFLANANNRKLQFSINLKNKGNVSADIEVKVRLLSLTGHEVYHNGGVYPVLSNEKLDINYTENDTSKAPFWGGWYTANTEVRYNTDAGTLGFNPSSNQAEPMFESKVIFVLPSVSAILIVAGLIVFILAFVAYNWYDKKITTRRREQWNSYVIKKGDTLEMLSATYEVSWKLIAKANNFKPPYSLEAGKKIKLPARHMKDKNRRNI